ncbi:spermidine acetyltransferase [Brevibacillus reuszeri]|uniref:Spermidine acetyltransferase n=1 Tax=Brevibacillus reuszeri TaxID=54915 RepID=A0A0K9Z0Z2_9BACL|nr:GNAT family N-acetyltransferase [Brevibacillus reuszeri]KNB74596.1 spermidine acetyltransferase [Brevibacillus reuszeri]MED1856532.1 GNAT family N-acetyltransferase [Brevibacillus reuszeri]GED67769.1 spermidine acetyltransferase [Brevibacillus reuszeri]
MRTVQVELVEVDAENWYACCLLEVSEEQKSYMVSNAVSIAQTKFEPTLQALSIIADGQQVGFCMYNTRKEELDGYWIYRIMVDKKYQGKGIGKAATQLLLAKMAELPDARKIVVGYHPENRGAHQLYASVGFSDEGHKFGQEMAVIKYIAQ